MVAIGVVCVIGLECVWDGQPERSEIVSSPAGGKGRVGREVKSGGFRGPQGRDAGPNRAELGSGEAVQSGAGWDQIGVKVGAKSIVIVEVHLTRSLNLTPRTRKLAKWCLNGVAEG